MLTMQAFIQSSHLGLWLQFLEPFLVLSNSELFWNSVGLLLFGISVGFYFLKSIRSVNFLLSKIVAKFVEIFHFLWLLLPSLVYPLLFTVILGGKSVCLFNWESTPDILSFWRAIFYIWLSLCVLQLRSKFIFIFLLRSNLCPSLSSIYIITCQIPDIVLDAEDIVMRKSDMASVFMGFIHKWKKQICTSN